MTTAACARGSGRPTTAPNASSSPSGAGIATTIISPGRTCRSWSAIRNTATASRAASWWSSMTAAVAPFLPTPSISTPMTPDAYSSVGVGSTKVRARPVTRRSRRRIGAIASGPSPTSRRNGTTRKTRMRVGAPTTTPTTILRPASGTTSGIAAKPNRRDSPRRSAMRPPRRCCGSPQRPRNITTTAITGAVRPAAARGDLPARAAVNPSSAVAVRRGVVFPGQARRA